MVEMNNDLSLWLADSHGISYLEGGARFQVRLSLRNGLMQSKWKERQCNVRPSSILPHGGTQSWPLWDDKKEPHVLSHPWLWCCWPHTPHLARCSKPLRLSARRLFIESTQLQVNIITTGLPETTTANSQLSGVLVIWVQIKVNKEDEEDGGRDSEQEEEKPQGDCLEILVIM